MEKKIRKILKDKDVSFQIQDNIVFLDGKVKDYDEWVQMGLQIGEISDVDGVVNQVTWREKHNKKLQKRMEKRSRVYEQNKDKKPKETDVVVIGGGIIGCFIARELSKYKCRVILLEKEPDVSLGASRANNGMVHPGISPSYKTLKRKLNIQGNQDYDQICEELNVSFRRSGSLILITPKTLEEYRRYLPGFLYKFFLKHILPFFVKLKGKRNGVKNIEIVKNQKIWEMEPWATRDALSAVYIPSTGILDPYDLTIALAENAEENNAKIECNQEVVGFKKQDDNIISVVTGKGVYNCKMVINAAGVFADEIAELAGTCEYTIHPRKGVELLFDRRIQPSLYHCLAELKLPSHPTSKGGGVNPTVHKNIIWGPTAVEIPDKNDTTVGREEICEMQKKYKSVLKEDFPSQKIIRYFAGVRAPTFTEDFIIRPAKWTSNFIHVAGIQSPGVASAPAIAKYVLEIIQTQGLNLKKKEDFSPLRKPIVSAKKMNSKKLEEKIQDNPKWGNIICTCEMVSEAEIIEAIRRGAESIDAIKRRTRACMGNCQGSYCELRIAKILARELDQPLNQVVKENKKSRLFNGYVRGEKP
ncbi:MAG: NAD(P)/FAD-dependent oxidoreductase [Candidatus Thermoplasmatota archaeon]